LSTVPTEVTATAVDADHAGRLHLRVELLLMSKRVCLDLHLLHLPLCPLRLLDVHLLLLLLLTLELVLVIDPSLADCRRCHLAELRSSVLHRDGLVPLQMLLHHLLLFRQKLDRVASP